MRGLTGQLEVFADGKAYTVAFQRGNVVAAHSPLVNDAAVRLALTGNLITSTQVAEITRRMAAQPDRDEVELLAEIIRLPAEQAQRLRRRLVAQRAARTFSAERGEFVVRDLTTLPVVAGTALDIRTVVYLGARSNLSEQRLAAELAQMGVWFQIKPDTLPDLAQYGFTDAEKPILKMLIEGANVSEIEALHRDLGVRAIHAVGYALAACNACDRSITPRPSARQATPSGTSPPLQPGAVARSGTTMTPPAGVARSGTTMTPPAGVSRSGPTPSTGQRVHTPTAAPSVIRMPPSPTSVPPSSAQPDTGPVRVSRTSAPPPGAPIDQMVPRSGTTSQHRAPTDTRSPGDPGAPRYPTPTGVPRMPSDPGAPRTSSDSGFVRMSDPGARPPTPTGLPRMPSDPGAPSGGYGRASDPSASGYARTSDPGAGYASGPGYTSDPGASGYGSDPDGSPGYGSDGSRGSGSQGYGSDGSQGSGSQGYGSDGSQGYGPGGSPGYGPGSPGYGSDGSPGYGPGGSPGYGSDGSPGYGSDGEPGYGPGSPGYGPGGSQGYGSDGSQGSGSPGYGLSGSQGGSQGSGSQGGSQGSGSQGGSQGSGSQGGSQGSGSPGHGPGGSQGYGRPSESGPRLTPTGLPRMPSDHAVRSPTPTGLPRMPSDHAVRSPTPTGLPRMPSDHVVRSPTPTGLPRMPSEPGGRSSGPPSRPSDPAIGRSQTAGPPSRASDPAIGRTHTPAAQSRVSTDPAVSRVPTPAAASRTQTDPAVGRSPSPQGPNVGRSPSPQGPNVVRAPSPQSPNVGRVPTGPAEGRVPTSPTVTRTPTGPQMSRTGTGPQVSRTTSPSGGIPSAMNPAGTGSHRSVEGTAPPATRPIPPSVKRARRDSAALAEIEDLLTDKIPLLDRGVDHFTLLGLPQDASPTDVRSAYFSLARKLHPDRLAAIGVFDEERRAQRLMAQVNLAFAVLNDPGKRDEYMKLLRRGGEAVAKAEDAKADELAMAVMRAEEAFKQGEMALRRDQIQQAIDAFAIAVELQPREAEYQAMLAWAQFAGASDKSAIASNVRKTLLRAAEDNDRSVTARFYLGRVERMLGREKEALAHFQEVLRVKPNHSEATSEARILEQRLRNKR